jgi:hypothetical protein
MGDGGAGGSDDGIGGGYVSGEVAPDGSTVATANTKIELVFDRYLDPRTVQRASVCLRSDPAPVNGFQQCTGGVLLNAAYDPAGRVVTYYVDPGQTPQLLPAATHFLTVHLGDEPGEAGFHAYDGAPLAQKYELFFGVVDQGGLTPQGPPTFNECSEVRSFLESSCGGCHAAQGPENPDGAPENLIFKPFNGFSQRSQVVAHGASLGGTGNQGSLRPDRFGAGMNVVTANDPGNSYILYKLLAGLPVDAATIHPDETGRIRADLITGTPMPPDNAQNTQAAESDIRLLSRWIAAGAPSCDL